MRLIPMASTMVTTGGKPFGNGGHPQANGDHKHLQGGPLLEESQQENDGTDEDYPTPMILPILFKRCCKGVCGDCSCSSMWAMRPMAVSMPVAATTPTPAPEATPVEANAIFFLSPKGAF